MTAGKANDTVRDTVQDMARYIAGRAGGGAGAGRPILLAGPTASGKSALAVAVAQRVGGVVVNADALQVYANWRLLTARPGPEDLAAVPHALYGHIGQNQDYSVGHWLRDLAPLLEAGRQGSGPRPVIVGGTGLYMTVLTEGLTEIPMIPPAVRAESETLLAAGGLARMLDDLDLATRARIDTRNPMRVQRAWEVLRATGRGISEWQNRTGPALLPLADAAPFILDPGKAVLDDRILRRFDAMLAGGLLAEVAAQMPGWRQVMPSSRAIGSPELVAHLRGLMTLADAREAAIIATRQYAKRQRTWLRNQLSRWERLLPEQDRSDNPKH